MFFKKKSLFLYKFYKLVPPEFLLKFTLFFYVEQINYTLQKWKNILPILFWYLPAWFSHLILFLLENTWTSSRCMVFFLYVLKSLKDNWLFINAWFFQWNLSCCYMLALALLKIKGRLIIAFNSRMTKTSYRRRGISKVFFEGKGKMWQVFKSYFKV